MRKVAIFALCMLFMLEGWAQASYTLSLGGSYSYPIYSLIDPDGGTWNPESKALGGGSIDASSLNGTTLQYVYCVDLFTTVYVPGTYPETLVNNEGKIRNSLVNNAGQVAWLLANYGTGGQGYQAMALQAAIWNVINGSSVYQLDSVRNPTDVVTLYNSMLTKLGSHTGDISDFYWITPGKDSNGQVVQYQGLVAPVPIPAAAWLLGSGLVGLVVIRRRMKK